MRNTIDLLNPHLREFFSIAAEMNQDINKICEPEGQRTYFRVDTIEEGRKFFSRASSAAKKIRSETFMEGLEYRSRLGQGMHDRGEAAIFANHPVEEKKDSRGLNHHFPIYVRAISIADKVVAAGETWDITLNREEWSVHEREEMYNIVNIGRLTLEKNARIVVRGDILVFICQELVKEHVSSLDYDFGVLGTPHGFGSRYGDFHGRHGRNGINGAEGKQVIMPQLGAGFLGKLLPHSFSKRQMDGGDGAEGSNGTDGENGLNGGACRTAEINIRSIVTEVPVVIAVIPGNGGNGGKGGHGGNGGNGSNGIDAFRTVDGITEEGAGGRGGAGGNGGNGGKAGHSGISSNVFIDIPPSEIEMIRCYSKFGKAGIPGEAGLPGKSGKGGFSGKSLKNEEVTIGAAGKDGLPGKPGKAGRVMPPAKIYLNNIVVNNAWT